MENNQAQDTVQNETKQAETTREGRKYCPLRAEGSRCSSFCALWYQGVCSIFVLGAYFGSIYQMQIASQEGENSQ